ncbi:MAG: hypothetical protein HWE07_01205 [Cytophagia bacterium]|nr:hypothetical protein [Cytophagia bacterium]
MKRYLISETDTDLVITKNPGRAKANFYITFLLVIVWYAAIIGSHKTSASNFVYLFYLAPLLLIPQGYKYLNGGFSPIKITFSKKLKTIDLPGKELIDFNSVKKVVIDYPNKYQIEECTLNLDLLEGREIEIDRSDASFNSEVIQTAKIIAQILGVPVEDKHPYIEKL